MILSKQNCVGVKLSNVITSSHRHRRTQRFPEQKQRNAGLILSTARESPDLKHV